MKEKKERNRLATYFYPKVAFFIILDLSLSKWKRSLVRRGENKNENRFSYDNEIQFESI